MSIKLDNPSLNSYLEIITWSESSGHVPNRSDAFNVSAIVSCRATVSSAYLCYEEGYNDHL